jgi:Ni,Fe-hydrogenase I large subunit
LHTQGGAPHAIAAAGPARGGGEGGRVEGFRGETNRPVEALFSTRGRTAARARARGYCGRLRKHVFDTLIRTIRNGDRTTANAAKRGPSTRPTEARDVCATGVRRDALGHGIRVKDGRIANESCRVPTNRNGSPRDAGVPIPAVETPVAARACT